jgi:acetyl-CoA/propionyl-CoA carboxylase, biotin carboxylase, biotin carboxyl carrier protein
LRALGEFHVEGPKTLIGFHRALLSHDCFVRGETCHGLVESDELAARAAELDGVPASSVAASSGKTVERARVVEVAGRRFEVRIADPEPPWRELSRRRRERERAGGGVGGDAVVSPMQGTVLSVAVAEGDVVEAGQVICIVEAMKMENEVRTHRAGTVEELSVGPGKPVTTGQTICLVTGDYPPR